MPPIPKFAKALAKLAKANPKVIPGETPPKIKKRNTSEKTIEKQIETKKFAKDNIEIDKIRRKRTKKELEQSLPKKARDDSSVYKNLLALKATDKLQGYKSDEKVKIFNKDNLKEFVEISWPKEATAYNVVESVVRVMVEKYIKK